MRVKLVKFDRQYFDLLHGNGSVYPPDENSVYHIVLADGIRAGIVGYVSLKADRTIGFVQIVLEESFRGKGLVKIAEDLLVEKYGLKKLYATVKIANCASLFAHKKIGFTELSENEVINLRSQGFLREDETRLVKEYN